MHNTIILTSLAVGVLMLVAAFFLNRRLGGDRWANPFTYEPAAQYLCFGGIAINFAGVAIAKIFL
jgi:hypothetical protein